MSEVLPGYVQGAWWTPDSDAGALIVRDASTGEEITRVSSQGIDLTGALDYARTVGQASLGALTFHQRAVLLKQFALALTERKDELYALSARTGATKADSWVDIDGGIGVLFAYSGKGRRELPNGHVYVDGPIEPLSKDGTFLGRHVFTRLPGVAVQINAFNFPVWGALEKFAPAFLAGMPTLVKPATPTGYLAEAFVRILVESELLPDGSLQLVSGSVHHRRRNDPGCRTPRPAARAALGPSMGAGEQWRCRVAARGAGRHGRRLRGRERRVRHRRSGLRAARAPARVAGR